MYFKMLAKQSLKNWNNAFIYDKQTFRAGDNTLLPPLEGATLILESLSEWNIVFVLCSVTDRDTSGMCGDYVTNFRLRINISG